VLNVIMLSVAILSLIVLNVVMLGANKVIAKYAVSFCQMSLR
jgi:hypothetical protein